MQTNNNSRLAVGLASLALLAACGGADKSKETATTTSEVTTTTAVPEATAPAAEPAAAPMSAPAATVAPAAGVTLASLTGDAAKGEKVFAQCKTCHVAEKGVNRVGPSLWGIVGRTAGSIEGFKYSKANKNSGYVWSEDQLFTYLEAPQRVMPGTIMAFGGLKKPQDRADIIAYLKTKA